MEIWDNGNLKCRYFLLAKGEGSVDKLSLRATKLSKEANRIHGPMPGLMLFVLEGEKLLSVIDKLHRHLNVAACFEYLKLHFTTDRKKIDLCKYMYKNNI